MGCVGYMHLYKRGVILLHKYCSFLVECSIFVCLQNVVWVSYFYGACIPMKFWINRLAIHRLWFQQIYVEIQTLLIELLSLLSN